MHCRAGRRNGSLIKRWGNITLYIMALFMMVLTVWLFWRREKEQALLKSQQQ
ncbi:MAG: hypothetical protein RR387_04295 [Clostridiales bacterium]